MVTRLDGSEAIRSLGNKICRQGLTYDIGIAYAIYSNAISDIICRAAQVRRIQKR